MDGTRFRVGAFVFDPRSGELTRGDEVQRLRPQAATALEALAEAAGQLVSRGELIERIWPQGGSEPEVGLNVSIGQVRAALGDDADQPAYVETLRGRGYRLIARVEALSPTRRSRAGRTWGGVALATLVGSGVLWSLGSLTRPDSVRIAVMPFRAPAPVETDSLAHFRRGLAEDVITALASARPTRIAVLARTSSFGLADAGVEAPALATELAADYVLEGTLRETTPGQYRVTAQLLDASRGTYVWAHQFDRDRAGLVELDGPLAVGVLATVVDTAGWAREGESSSPRLSAADRETLLRARYLIAQRTVTAGQQAVQELTAALGVNPGPDPLWVELANAHLLLGQIDEADSALHRAAMQDSLAPAYLLAAGRVAAFGRRDVHTANRILARAVTEDPGSAEVRHVYAQTLAAVGRLDEAMEHGRVALDLDPVSASVRGDIGWVLYYGGAFEEARARCASTLELRPQSRGALTCLILSAHFDGSLEREASRVQEAVTLLGGSVDEFERLFESVETGDPTSLWEWMLRRGLASGALDPVTGARLAALAGHENQALELLEQAADAGRRHLWAGVDPTFDALHTNARFQAVASHDR